MNPNDQKVIDKYNFTEDEIESYVERMGIMVEDNGDNEKESARKCIQMVLDKRNE